MDFAANCTNIRLVKRLLFTLFTVIALIYAQNAHAKPCSCAVVEGLLGHVSGNAIGRTIDQSDLRSAEKGFYKASRVAVGERVFWHNECTGNWGIFVAVCDSNAQCGNYCRKFATEVCMNGQVTKGYGTACRQPNGNWYMLNT